MPSLVKRSCAEHSIETSCSTLSSGDVVSIAAAAALCSSVLLVLGVIWLRRWLKARAQEKAMTDLSDRPMSSLGTPLIGSRAPFETMSSSHHNPSRPPLSPHSTASSIRSHSSMSAESRSPYSPTLENFHFPILSADGHLLPPPPASSRQSFIDVNDSAERPLPSPPAVTAPVLATLPHLPKRWSYEHAYEEIKVDDSSKLLYEGVDFGSDGRPERKKGYHHKSTDVACAFS